MKTVFVMVMVLALSGLVVATHAGNLGLEWGRQFGSCSDDSSRGIGVDGQGNIYTAGWEGGNPGSTTTTYVSKYRSDGEQIWKVTETRNHNEYIFHSSADRNGNVYVSGDTQGSSGGSYNGWNDGFIRKYDTSGRFLWGDQIGTSDWEIGRSSATDSQGNVYFSGFGPNRDAFLAKYDQNGNRQWLRQYSVGYFWRDPAYILVSPTGDIYLMGGTSNPGESGNGLLMKVRPDGSLAWGQTIGTPDHVDGGFKFLGFDSSGRIVFNGETRGALVGANHGGTDLVLGRSDSDGHIEWLGQYGTEQDDYCYDGVLGPGDTIAMVGFTTGSLFASNAGGNDAYIARFSADGQMLGGMQFGTAGSDVLNGIGFDGQSYIVGGVTNGALWGSNSGGYDIIMGRVGAVPEPSGLLVLMSGVVAALRGVFRRRD